jgi:hypothetical protein
MIGAPSPCSLHFPVCKEVLRNQCYNNARIIFFVLTFAIYEARLNNPLTINNLQIAGFDE